MIILMPATVWHILNVKLTLWPETEVTYGKLLKTCEIALGEAIFGEFLAIWFYCVVSSSCLQNPGSQQY